MMKQEAEGEDDVGDDVSLEAVEALYARLEDPQAPVDRIERFCLPVLGSAGSQVALERAVRGIETRPHLAQVYASYVLKAGRSEPDTRDLLEAVLEFGQFAYEWQLMWLLGVLTYMDGVDASTVRRALRVVQDHTTSPALRATAVQLVARHGSAVRRRSLRNLYADEPSDYVRSAMLFGARYFPTPERRTCIGAWGGHSAVNALVSRAVAALT